MQELELILAFVVCENKSKNGATSAVFRAKIVLPLNAFEKRRPQVTANLQTIILLI
jgi:hypothetical protein